MDGATSGSKTIADPEGLLRSALEKIVFFECRVSQLESELAAARSTGARARGDASRAERRDIELEQALAGERGARADAERRASELDDRVRLLEAERERLLAGLVDRARVSGTPGASGGDAPEEGGADLAGFIAELRAEIESLRIFKAEVEAAGYGRSEHAEAPVRPERGAAPVCPERSAAERRGVEGRPGTVSDLAGRFEQAGRVGLTVRDTDRMKDLPATRADRALYERSMDDLAAPDTAKRLRAVRALEALGSKAAAPLLAAALGRERDAQVKAALLAALARFREPFAAGLAERELGDARPAVRVAALEALSAVAAGAAGEKLAAALSDESPLVRRRAALLLGFQAGDRAEESLAVALCDADRGVARAAAAALSGRPSARAQEALARGLEHPDVSVRRAAAFALSRISGEAVDADASPSARRAASRRIAERLAAMDGDEIRAAVLKSAATAKTTAERVIARTAPAPVPVVMAAQAAARAPVALAVLAPATAAPAAAHLEPRLVAEIRAALRGCTADALAGAVGAPLPQVEAALRALAANGAVAQRGTRWFMS